MIWQQYEKYAEDALSRPTLVAIIKMREKLMGSAAGLRHAFFLPFLPLSNSVYPGSDFFHPGPQIFPSRIRIKEFKYFNLKKWFLTYRKYV
jgi:hypothetical protein